MNYIYLVIFQGGNRHLLNVIRTNEKYDNTPLYAKASRHTYQEEEPARKVMHKLAKDNFLSYIDESGTIIEYKVNNNKYLD